MTQTTPLVVRRIGVKGHGIWLGEDGVWNLEDTNAYEFIPGQGLLLVRSEKRNPVEPGEPLRRLWDISLLGWRALFLRGLSHRSQSPEHSTDADGRIPYKRKRKPS
jgi:hypothetical protein